MKISLIVFALMLLVVSSEAKWSCFSKYDKMDDVRVNGCSTDDTTGYRTFRGAPSLLVRTSNDELEIYLSAGEYVGNIENIEVKFDSQPKETIGVGSSTDNIAMFIDASARVAFLEKIMKYKKLLVRFTPYSENPRTLEFNLVGFKSKDSSKLLDKIQQIVSARMQLLAQELAEAEKAEKEANEKVAREVAEAKANEKAEKLEKEANEKAENEKKVKLKKEAREAVANGKIIDAELCEMLGKKWEWNGQCL
jgi:hypothetical protein